MKNKELNTLFSLEKKFSQPTRLFAGQWCQREGVNFITDGSFMVYGDKIRDEFSGKREPFLDCPNAASILPREDDLATYRDVEIPQFPFKPTKNSLIVAAFDPQFCGLVFHDFAFGKCDGDDVIGFNVTYLQLLSDLGFARIKLPPSKEKPLFAESSSGLRALVMPCRIPKKEKKQ